VGTEGDGAASAESLKDGGGKDPPTGDGGGGSGFKRGSGGVVSEELNKMQ